MKFGHSSDAAKTWKSLLSAYTFFGSFVLLPACFVSYPTAVYSQAHDYGLPVAALGRYEIFRKEMLKNKYVPVPQAGHVDSFVEVSCGNTICSAEWLTPDRRKINFTIWFEYKGKRQVLYLAPQAE